MVYENGERQVNEKQADCPSDIGVTNLKGVQGTNQVRFKKMPTDQQQIPNIQASPTADPEGNV